MSYLTVIIVMMMRLMVEMMLVKEKVTLHIIVSIVVLNGMEETGSTASSFFPNHAREMSGDHPLE